MPVPNPSLAGKDAATQTWELEVTNRLNQLEYSLGNQLVVNNVSSKDYNGETQGEVFSDFSDNPGTAGYYLDSKTGTAIFSNAVIRGESKVNSANIGGTVQQALIARESVVIGSSSLWSGDSRVSESNLIDLGTRTYNTHSTLADQGNGTFAVLSSGTLIEQNDSNGTAYPELAGVPTSAYAKEYFAAKTTNNGGNTVWQEFGPYKQTNSGYEGVFFNTRARNGNTINNTAPLVIKQYGAYKHFTNTRVLTLEAPYSGKIKTKTLHGPLVTLTHFPGASSSDSADFDDLTLNATVTVVVYTTAKGSATVTNTKTYTDTLIVTSGNVSGTNFFESSLSGRINYWPDVDLDDWDNLNQTDELHFKLSITYNSETNFNGWMSVIVDSDRMFVVEADEDISNADTFIAGSDPFKFAAEIIGGQGLYAYATKIFEGEVLPTTKSGSTAIHLPNSYLINPATNMLIRYKWNNGNSTDKTKTNSGLVMISLVNYKVDGGLEGDSDSVARVYATNEGGSFWGTGTDKPRELLGYMYDHDENIIGVVQRDNHDSSNVSLFVHVKDTSIGLKVTDMWVLNGWR